MYNQNSRQPDSEAGVPSPAESQSYPMPYLGPVVPLQYADLVISQNRDIYAAIMDNVQLRYQLNQKHLAEEAYTKALEDGADRIQTLTRYGGWAEILNCTVEWAVLVKPQPPLRAKPHYNIKLSRSEQPISLTEEEYLKDGVFINKLREIRGVEVTIRKTQKNTADLLRAAISRKLEELTVSIYNGWLEQAEGKYHFWPILPVSSRWKGNDQKQYMLPATPPAVTALAIQNWQPAFLMVTSAFVRWFLFIWFHTAFLTSLLNKLGHRPPLGLYAYCDNPTGSAYMHRLFCWYDDKALSIDMSPADFVDEALRRKDQPLVIEDAGSTRNTAKNVSTVETMLPTGSLPWKNGRDTQSLPVQALPTILSTTVTGLVCDPMLITLELSADQFLPDQFPQTFPTGEELEEYLTAFANYTSAHITELRTSLDTTCTEAWGLADGILAEPYVEMMGIMLGLSRFLDGFRSVDPSAAGLLGEENVPQLLALLGEACSKAGLSSSLTDQFISMTRSMVQHGQLELCPRTNGEVASQDTAAVYFDEISLYFTKKALETVCRKSGYSRPVVLRALTDAGLVEGHPINKATVMTRIRLWNVYGVHRDIPVYRLRRDAFEEFGDPLIIGEGG